MLPARVDGRGTLGADRKFRLLRIIQDDFDRVLALGDVWSRLLKLGNFITWQILSLSITTPDAVDLGGEDLARIEVKRDFDGLSRPHVFQALLVKGRKQVTVGFRDQGRDAADAIDAGHQRHLKLK